MKKSILLMLFMLLSAYYVQAQKVDLNFVGGYFFRDKVDFGNYYGYIEDAGAYGVSIEAFVRKNQSAELSYLRQDTHAPLYGYNTGIQYNKDQDKISVNYITLGFVNYFTTPNNISPYAGLGIGVGIVSSKDGGGSLTKFAYNAKLGVKIKTASAVSFKLQAQLQSIVQGSGSTIYIGTGGAGAGITTYSSVLQFGFLGGIAINLH